MGVRGRRCKPTRCEWVSQPGMLRHSAAASLFPQLSVIFHPNMHMNPTNLPHRRQHRDSGNRIQNRHPRPLRRLSLGHEVHAPTALLHPLRPPRRPAQRLDRHGTDPARQRQRLQLSRRLHQRMDRGGWKGSGRGDRREAEVHLGERRSWKGRRQDGLQGD
jgi:hypothetical protein